MPSPYHPNSAFSVTSRVARISSVSRISRVGSLLCRSQLSSRGPLAPGPWRASLSRLASYGVLRLHDLDASGSATVRRPAGGGVLSLMGAGMTIELGTLAEDRHGHSPDGQAGAPQQHLRAEATSSVPFSPRPPYAGAFSRRSP